MEVIVPLVHKQWDLKLEASNDDKLNEHKFPLYFDTSTRRTTY